MSVENQQEKLIGGFEVFVERPPDSLVKRFLVTLRHMLGLLFGGGFAYVHHREEQGIPASSSIFLLRTILLFARPFLGKDIIQRPFPVQFRIRLELLGPTYIKLGQILSLRQDLLPKSITDELQNLLDRLPVVNFARYKELIEADLAISTETAFAWIDPIPLGSASLGQTHRARLLTGEEVVLKVIKPGVRETIHTDTILLRITGFTLQIFLARFQPKRTINEFCKYTFREVDLTFEADNAETFVANFKDYRDVRFPKVYREYSGSDVLCMEFFSGMKPTAAAAAMLTPSEKNRIIDLGVGSIVKMIFQDGFFHADLHPGNLIIFENRQIGFIDLGMVGRLDDETRRTMLYYFYSLVMNDAANAARILAAMALRGPKSDPEGFRREVADLNRRWISSSRRNRLSAAQLILQSIALAARYRIYYPEEIILMVKALVTVEGVGNLLEPGMELTGVARKHVTRIIIDEFSPVTIYRKSMLSAPEFLDVMTRSPMILARTLQQMERHNQVVQAQPFGGFKEVLLAGFCLVAVAILAASGASWLIWSPLLLFAVIVAIRGLS